MAISALFDISMDELLSNEKGAKKPTDYLFESITEYDIDEPKRFDMKFGGAKKFCVVWLRERENPHPSGIQYALHTPK